jgi:hypothetical protein
VGDMTRVGGESESGEELRERLALLFRVARKPDKSAGNQDQAEERAQIGYLL